MKRSYKWLAAGMMAAAALATLAVWAHCEIPCGIYDDALRMKLIYEDIATIAKSVHEINDLEASGKNANQLVRWINNKENHADKLQETVTQYFMTQRVKPVAEGDAGYSEYVAQVTAVHAVLVEAMKAKQGSNPETAVKLQSLAEQFDHLYFHQDK